jgi:hypothetical protein
MVHKGATGPLTRLPLNEPLARARLDAGDKPSSDEERMS